MSFQSDPGLRMIPHLSAKDEWAYLTNETLEGERTIVPLLKEMIEQSHLPLSLIRLLEEQYDEEISHVREYHALVGQAGLQSTGYGAELKTYVKSLDRVALKLFSLQALLEGIAMGALMHRLHYWKGSPSYKMDLQALVDEEKHTTLSWPIFRELIEAEGMCSAESFRKVEKDVNGIFKRAFSGEAISKWAETNIKGSQKILPDEIESSKGIQIFKNKSTQILSRTKNEFLSKYRGAAHDAST